MRRWIVGLLLAVCSFSAAALLLATRRPLGSLGGLTDEWLLLGLDLATQGTLGLGNQPTINRPPGYPFFIAAVLKTVAPPPVPEGLTTRYFARAETSVYVAQALLLGLATSTLFVWLDRRLRRGVSTAIALAFGLNPNALLLCGLAHYDVLHILLLILSGWTTDAALRSPTRRTPRLLACGVLWGITTLVRPITLLLPPFFLLLGAATNAGAGSAWRRALRTAALLTTGMIVTILPWTVRNQRVTGHLVMVNAQGWAALWGSTVQPLPLDANRYLWYLLTTPEQFQPILERVTGQRQYSFVLFLKHNLALEEAFRDEAFKNLRARPLVYVGNVSRALVSLNVLSSSLFLRVFERIQRPQPGEFALGWPTRDGASERQPTAVSRAFDLSMGLVTALAALGLVAALWRRDSFALLPLVTWACICVAHGLSYMDLMYYYLKLPFVMIFAGLGLEALAGVPRLACRWRGRTVTLGSALAAALALVAFGLSAALWLATNSR